MYLVKRKLSGISTEPDELTTEIGIRFLTESIFARSISATATPVAKRSVARTMKVKASLKRYMSKRIYKNDESRLFVADHPR